MSAAPTVTIRCKELQHLTDRSANEVRPTPALVPVPPGDLKCLAIQGDRRIAPELSGIHVAAQLVCRGPEAWSCFVRISPTPALATSGDPVTGYEIPTITPCNRQTNDAD